MAGANIRLCFICDQHEVEMLRRTSPWLKSLYKKLFTPGPLSVTESVREAMTEQILGSREDEFIQSVSCINSMILSFVGNSADQYRSILMQGSGTFGVESVLQTFISPADRVLVLSNGAYGNRLATICEILNLNHESIFSPEDETMDIESIESVIRETSPDFVVMVHCETSTGMLNPVAEVGDILKDVNSDATFVVDGMSSFGGVSFDVGECDIDFLITSVNKCIQGVPGASIIIANAEKMDSLTDHSRTLSLNVIEQHKGFEQNGQFRFTPPIECLLALKQALTELSEETVEGREKRYIQNFEELERGMIDLGYVPYLSSDLSSHIINSFHYPDEPLFDFEELYQFLLDDGLYIYPGKVSNADVFRIGTIGDIDLSDVKRLLKRFEEYNETVLTK